MHILKDKSSSFSRGKESCNLSDKNINICHFMLLRQKDGTLDIDLSTVGLTDNMLREFSQIDIVANDSEQYIADISKDILEKLAGISVWVKIVASFRDCELPSFGEQNLVILINYTSEDEKGQCLLRKAREAGANVLLATYNISESSVIGKENKNLYASEDIEPVEAKILVCNTILMAFYALAVKMARIRERLNDAEYRRIIVGLSMLPNKVQRVLRGRERIRWMAEKYADASSIYFIGNGGLDYVVATEGSRIIKRLEWEVHSEAYNADELDEKELDTIKKGSLLLFVLAQDTPDEKIVNIMNRCKSKGVCLMVLTIFGNFDMEDMADFTVYIPKTEDYFIASLAVIPLHFLGYYIGLPNK